MKLSKDVVAGLFILRNQIIYCFQATGVEAAVRMLTPAAGEMSETEFAAWLKENSRRVQGRALP